MPAATLRIDVPLPDSPERVMVAIEETAALALTVGLVRAAQAAGWYAVLHGSATITHIESGRSWSFSCAEAGPSSTEARCTRT